MEFQAKATGQEKRKDVQIGKEKLKLSLFSDDTILYTENSKEFTEKVLELINEFNKVAGYKINTQKSTVFWFLQLKNPREKSRKQFHLPMTPIKK